jgi:hypothetical protein
MMNPKHPSGPPMTLGNVRDLGVKRLIASCLNGACRHVALIDVFELFSRNTCAVVPRQSCLREVRDRGNKIDVRSNWKKQPVQPSLTGKQWR